MVVRALAVLAASTAPLHLRPVTTEQLPNLLVGKFVQAVDADPHLPSQNYLLYEWFEQGGVYRREIHGFEETGKYVFRGDEFCTDVDGEEPELCRRALIDGTGNLWFSTGQGASASLSRHLISRM